VGTTPYTRHLPAFYTGLIAHPECEHCPLNGETIVPPEGNPRADIVLVGRDPGEHEEREKRVFVGNSGGLLNLFLERAGIARPDIWITNNTLCRAQAKDYRGKRLSAREVYALAAKFCRPRLLSELRAIDPKVVVPLGQEALVSLIPYAHSITRRRGQVHELDLEQRHRDAARERDHQLARGTQA
jgi:DNA polymerase